MSASRTDRGVGYCQNVKCAQYVHQVFVLGHEVSGYRPFVCRSCGKTGRIEREWGQVTGEGRVREVKVNFAFEPSNGLYREMLLLVDDELPPGATYTFWSPLIRNELRAGKVAEMLLVSLGETGEPDTGFREHILSFDDPLPVFARKAAELGERLANNPFFRRTPQ